MGVRFWMARAVGAASTAVLRGAFRRPAENFPGKAALAIDPRLIADLRGRVREGSICVVGTNGKTTVTNLLADTFEASGRSVACNRTGANLDSGVATALLHARPGNESEMRSPTHCQGVDWGVFECDELWLAKVAPQLRPDYVLLLNLFRDQLDRVGEIDHIQENIVSALESSPGTVLAYNADDPLCQAIADRARNESVPFGIDGDLGLPQNTVVDARMCQRCDSMLEYAWRQYGQLGGYRCPTCGFARREPMYAACGVKLSESGSEFTLRGGSAGGLADDPASSETGSAKVRTALPGAYMAYNLLAVCAAADLCGVPLAAVQRAVDAFDPQNGRLQPYSIGGRAVLLNLAKNPTGFNQNLKIVMQGAGPKAVAFFINDREADGHDVSWLWDIDFQELASAGDLAAFAGGIRRNDMQVRLKYAGVNAELVDGAEDFLRKAAAVSPSANLYLIANYTALPGVKAALDRLLSAPPDAPGPGTPMPVPPPGFPRIPEPPGGATPSDLSSQKLVIAHLFPTLLNLYGDGGNVIVLERRARARGIDVEVVQVNRGDVLDFSRVDIAFLGGGPDREQRLASASLLEMRDDLCAYVEDDGVLLAICGGFQVLGNEWLCGEGAVPGLGLVDLTTRRAEGGSHNRLVGDIALESPLAKLPVVGYENHAGRTYLGAGCEPFGRVMGSHGKGNNDSDKADGVLYRNVVGTYLHGPLLAKNPEVADELLQRALDRRVRKDGNVANPLRKLDDSVEKAANGFMSSRLGVR